MAAGEQHPALLKPELATEKAPDTYKVKFETTKGDILILVHREWAPMGADRFYNLVKIGYFKDIAFYRVIHGFITQFGFSGDPAINEVWSDHVFKDDPVTQTNAMGRITFANRGPNTRATQLFINETNNGNLDGMGFAPFGEIVGDGLAVIKALYGGYGEGYPHGTGPNQSNLKRQGNAYLAKSYPELDYIKSAVIVD